jgi:3-oxoacyl-[acyl-carrier protein] reductase
MELVDLKPWPGMDGRIALVTGASRGIGRAIAEALAYQGAVVIGTSTTAVGAHGITARLSELGVRGRGVVLDVSEQDSVDALFEALKAANELPVILVNNAGITRDNLLMRMAPEEWDQVLNTNLTSLYRVCKAALRSMMRARTGRIINIASVVGLMGNAGQTNYAAAKAGMIGFGKALAREVASRNITVNTIAPGFIATDMTKELSEQQAAALLQQIPAARLGTPNDVAAAAVFLASDAAAYVTGETLNINGGLVMS